MLLARLDQRFGHRVDAVVGARVGEGHGLLDEVLYPLGVRAGRSSSSRRPPPVADARCRPRTPAPPRGRAPACCRGLLPTTPGSSLQKRSDGFWAFELERRGADRVVAVDIPSFEDFDWLPWIRESLGALRATRPHFDLAHAMRRSRVEHQACSVYDLSPEQVGTFDVVFCGSLLLHLQNPLRALVNIRSVTNELAIIETLLDPELDPYDRPWLAFGHREVEARLGEAAVYWKFSTRALREMMEYAGFSSTQPLPPFSLPPAGPQVVSVIGYPASTASLGVPST